MGWYTVVVTLVFGILVSTAESEDVEGSSIQITEIRGKVTIPEAADRRSYEEGRLDKGSQLYDQHLYRVTLNHGVYSVMPDVDGSFVIPDVPTGSYILDVVHPTFAFEPVVVEVFMRRNAAGDMTPRVQAFLHSGEIVKGAKLKYPLGLKAYSAFSYFQSEERMQIFGLLKSPLVIMALVSLGLMWLMPKLQESIDPEELQEVMGGDNAPTYQSEFMAAVTDNSVLQTVSRRGGGSRS